MPILYIQKEAADGMAESAHALSNVLPNEEGVFEFGMVRDLGSISDLTLVADTNYDNTTIGGLTPQALAYQFAEKIAVKNRKAVQDIYLIVSDAGLIQNGKNSLALKFIREMYALGFEKLTCHAITNPVNIPAVGMRVEVMRRTYQGNAPSRTHEGDIHTYIYTDEASRQLGDQIRSLQRTKEILVGTGKSMSALFLYEDSAALHREKLDREEAGEYFAPTILLTNTDQLSYKQALNKAYHTFTVDGLKDRYWLDNNSADDIKAALQYLSSLQQDPNTSIENQRIVTGAIHSLREYQGINLLLTQANPPGNKPFYYDGLLQHIQKTRVELHRSMASSQHIAVNRLDERINWLKSYYEYATTDKQTIKRKHTTIIAAELEPTIDVSLRGLTGDHLKTMILLLFADRIALVESSQELSELNLELCRTPEYRLLAEGQNAPTRFFSWRTSSVIALQTMIKDKMQDLLVNPGPGFPGAELNL